MQFITYKIIVWCIPLPLLGQYMSIIVKVIKKGLSLFNFNPLILFIIFFCICFFIRYFFFCFFFRTFFKLFFFDLDSFVFFSLLGSIEEIKTPKPKTEIINATIPPMYRKFSNNPNYNSGNN